MFKFHNWKRKIAVGLSTAVATVGTLTASVFASTTDYSDITDALTSKLTPAEVTAIIGTIIASGIGFVLLWWGARKLLRAIISAFKGGKIKF